MEKVKNIDSSSGASAVRDASAHPKRTLDRYPAPTNQSKRRLVERICEAGTRVSYETGEFLFAQGDSPRGIHVVLQGAAKLSVVSSYGKAITLGFCSPGTILGLVAATLRRPYETSAQAAVQSTAVFLTRDAFFRIAHENTEIAFGIAQSLSEEFVCLLDRFGAVSMSGTATQRLAALLLGLRCEKGVRVRLPGVTQDELGQMVGLSRETVSRILSRLKRQKILEWKDSSIVVYDPSGLTHLATPSRMTVEKSASKP